MKTRTILTALSLIATSAFLVSMAFIPATFAYGSTDNWQVTAAGTGSFCLGPAACGGFGFWGWCAFSGVSSGTNGDCQFSQYLHQGTPLGTAQCQTSFDITGWDVAASGDFEATSGTVTFHPGTSMAACIGLLAGAGIFVSPSGANTGTIIAPSDLGIPAFPGHYSLNGASEGPITFTELQFQVSFNAH